MTINILLYVGLNHEYSRTFLKQTNKIIYIVKLNLE